MVNKAKNQSSSNFDRLFGTSKTQENGRSIAGLMLLDPDCIETAEQPRTQFDETGLTELANSIRERREKNEGVEGTGILQPLLVSMPQTGTYRLVAGERRLRAARQLSLPFVPAIIVPDNPRERLISQLVENLQRANLNPLEEARALGAWITENKFTVRDAAAAIGKDKNYISNRLRLLKMGADVQEMVTHRADALIHAQLIDVIAENAPRRKLIRAVIQDGISLAELRRLIKPSNTPEAAVLSLHRDKQNQGEPSEPGDDLSLCRDNAAPRDKTASTISIGIEKLQDINSLLNKFEDVEEWSPDEKVRLKNEIKSLLQSIRVLQKRLAK